jgi:hypothetical protein
MIVKSTCVVFYQYSNGSCQITSLMNGDFEGYNINKIKINDIQTKMSHLRMCQNKKKKSYKGKFYILKDKKYIFKFIGSV